ncbi:hypothetical protein MFIFM68171_10882 [Madurella fahalii]|uniref:Protein kinase domain-containing protein n=1 Tax=Madurella fahalii TaxID=1157608 RepID=A0ABQ0GSH7_9PEZI
MASGNANNTPLPYREGDLIELEVLRNYLDPPLPQPCRATIARIFAVTMSPVMDIIIWPKLGAHIRAVLKLYDRRFGDDLRGFYYKHIPHTPARETAFQSFVRQGKMSAFLCELNEEEKVRIIPPQPSRQLYDGEDRSNPKEDAESIAKYEAALWRQCNQYFDNETEAYDRLSEIQGKSIPQMYGHVRVLVPSPDVPRDLQLSPYFEVKGILLQWVNGYSLTDLPTSPMAPSDTAEWAGIIQTAVDAAHDINKRGVVMEDCQPRNVVMDRRSQTPFLIDFAQCDFKDRMIERWHEEGEDKDKDEDEDEDEEPNPEAEYWVFAMSRDNPGAIGAVMRTKVLKTKGIELDIKYPDNGKILENIKRLNMPTKEIEGHVFSAKVL